MKKTLFIALMSMFAYISVNAENEELSNTVTDKAAATEETTAAEEAMTDGTEAGQTIEMNNAEAKQTTEQTAEQAAEQTTEQTAEQTAEQTTDAKPIENGLMLQYANLRASNSLATNAPYYNEGFRESDKWKKARTLRNIGMIATLVSIAATPIAAAIARNSYKTNSEGEEIVRALFDTVIIEHGVAYCMPTMIAGIVMWAVGCHKMKKARLSYTGNGVAYNF